MKHEEGKGGGKHEMGGLHMWEDLDALIGFPICSMIEDDSPCAGYAAHLLLLLPFLIEWAV